jgi:hypothetical protein
LESDFPVSEEQLAGATRPVGDPDQAFKQAKEHLRLMKIDLQRRIRVEWDEENGDAVLGGTVFLAESQLLSASDPRSQGTDGTRLQPFVFFLRSVPGSPRCLLHCTSPVGILPPGTSYLDVVDLQSELRGAKLCAVDGKEAESYTLAAEGDILFSPEVTQVEEVMDLLTRVTVAADEAERELFPDRDVAIDVFRHELHAEAHHATD